MVARWGLKSPGTQGDHASPPEARGHGSVLRRPILSRIRSRTGLIALAAVMVAGVSFVGAAAVLYRTEGQEIVSERYAQLEAIGELNAGRVTTWRAERLADVRTGAGSPLLREALERWTGGSPGAAPRDSIDRHLALIVEAYGYEHALITDLLGRPLLASETQHAALDSPTRALVARVLATRAPALADTFIAHEAGAVAPHLHVDVAAPITGLDGEPMAVLVLRADPAAGLYSQLRTWPSVNGRGTVFLVRRVGDQLAILGGGAAESARQPIMVGGDRLELSAVQAALRTSGRFEGPDHRGVPVLADLRQVPGSGWSVVTSVDAAGLEAETGYRTAFIILLVLLVALLVGGVTILTFGASQRDLIGRLFRAQSERRAVTRHYGLIGHLARDSVFLFDPSGRVVEANVAAERTYGYSADELLTLHVNDLRAPEDRPAIDGHWEAAARPGGVLFEIGQCRRDGSVFPAEVSARSIEIGDQVYRHSVVRDITERRRSEQEVLEQLSELRRWHAAALDREARILEMKQEVDSLLAEAGGTPRYDAIPSGAIRDAARREGADATSRHEDEKEPRATQTEALRRLEEARASRHALLSMIEDLRASEAAQREAAERYEGLVRHSPHAIFVNRDDRVVLANEACLRLFGATRPDELLGRSTYEHIHPDDREGIRDQVRTLREERGPMPTREGRIVRLDGAIVDVDVAASTFDDGDRVSIHVVLNDITERKRAEEEIRGLNGDLERRVLERTSELEEANRELESFSYSVSHDLRAPLRAITGFSSILARRHADQIDKEGLHFLENIVTSGERMGVLIDDLLAYARLGRRAVPLVPVPLGPIVARVRDELGDRIEASGARLEVAEPLATPLGDQTLLTQALINLVDNSLTYRRTGVAPHVRISAERHDGRVVVSVRDNGIGIAPENRERIFDVFARLHGDDEFPGTGIGLAIVRKTARLMAAEVSLESTLGSGSSFSLSLEPAAEASTGG